MNKIRLPQIKTFWVESYGINGSSSKFDRDVNTYITKINKITKNIPRIETNSKYVTVIYDEVIDIDQYQYE